MKTQFIPFEYKRLSESEQLMLRRVVFGTENERQTISIFLSFPIEAFGNDIILLLRNISEQVARALEFYKLCKTRRSIREFSTDTIPKETLEFILKSAGSAPSGANKQPWNFIVVTDPKIKIEIREAAEAEEKINYECRMPEEWLEDLEPFGTSWRVPTCRDQNRSSTHHCVCSKP